MPVKNLFLFFLSVVAFSQPIQAQDKGQASSAEDEYYEYTNAQDPRRNFKLIKPGGWIIRPDYMGYEIFMEPENKLEPTEENPLVANPNVSFKVLLEPIPIDEISLEEYKKIIQTNLENTLGPESGLNIFQTTLFPLDKGRNALVYDISFMKGKHEAYQTIVVTSDSKRLYRATLTDYKVFYMENREKLFPYMVGIQYEGPSPTRKSPIEKYGGVVAASVLALIALIGLMWLQGKRSQPTFQEFEPDLSSSSVSNPPNSQFSQDEVPSSSLPHTDSSLPPPPFVADSHHQLPPSHFPPEMMESHQEADEHWDGLTSDEEHVESADFFEDETSHKKSS